MVRWGDVMVGGWNDLKWLVRRASLVDARAVRMTEARTARRIARR